VDGSKVAKLDGSQPRLAGVCVGPTSPAGTVRTPEMACSGAGDHVCGTAYFTVLPGSPWIVGESTRTGNREASGSAVSATDIAPGATEGWLTTHGLLPSLPAATATTTPARTALAT